MIRRPPRSTRKESSAASDVYKRQTIFGPIVTAGGLNDGIPPSQITEVFAYDVPEDVGGRADVTCETYRVVGCFYYVFYILPDSGIRPTDSVEGWPVEQYVPDCSENSVIIDSIGDAGLENGIVSAVSYTHLTLPTTPYV